MALKLEVLQIYFACVVLILLPLAAELAARRRLFERLRTAEAMHRLMIERTSDVMMRVGRDGMIRYLSPAVRAAWGYRPDELVGRSLQGIIHGKDMASVLDARQRAVSTPGETISVEYRVLCKDGAIVWVESRCCATIDSGGRANGTVAIIRDMTERRQMIDDLAREATTDPLTGLFNRRAFDRALADGLHVTRTGEECGCLAIFDLDHFKRINDRHGHATGDRVLVLFAQVLRETVRAGDVIGRLGGEEFALLLRGASLEQARLICERIRVRLASSEDRSIAGEAVRATVSVGLAPMTVGKTIDAVSKAADEALYRAKNGGRNQLALAA